jgi:hypothetical protein
VSFAAQGAVHDEAIPPGIPEQLAEPLEQLGLFAGHADVTTALARIPSRHVENRRRPVAHLGVPGFTEDLQPLNVPGGDVGLTEEIGDFVQVFDFLPLGVRQPLALFADVNAVTTAAEGLVGSFAFADPAVMAHG